MKLLMRLGLGNLGRFSPLRCRRFIGLRRSIHVEPKESSDLPAAAVPQWAMLLCHDYRKNCVADVKTVAEAHDYTGRTLRVSLGLEAPPSSSILCYDWPVDEDDDEEEGLEIVAAHGDAVLLGMRRRVCPITAYDYFVYRATAPSLSLLPVRDLALQNETVSFFYEDPRERMLIEETTGLLRCRNDELLVVTLGVTRAPDAVELCVLCLGSDQEPMWEMRNVPVVHEGGSRGAELQQWQYSDRVVPVGDRFLCWVNYADSFLFTDVTEASPKLRYVPLPVETFPRRLGYKSNANVLEEHMQMYRNMCATGGDMVKFVTIDPRCCCGSTRDHGRGPCVHSRFTFRVTTWTLRLSMDEPMRWVGECALDCEELWAMPGYEDLPRVIPMYPIMSPDNPNIVILTVSEKALSYPDRKVWRIEVDTWSKQLLSVVRTSDRHADTHLPLKFQC